LQGGQLADGLLASQLAIGRVRKIRLHQPDFQLRRVGNDVIHLTHAHRAEDESRRRQHRRRQCRITRGAAVHRQIVKRAVDHHQEGRDAERAGELCDLDDQWVPGLRNPLAAGK
jgi:hypothetical protein